jgi:hypothetical protein
LHGNVKVPLKDIMSDPATHNRLTRREDAIMTDRGEPAKGRVIWEIGYFEKTTLEQHLDKKHKDYNEVKANIERESEQKLREAMAAGDQKKGEVEQQKKEDFKERSDEIVSASSPTNDWPSGILSMRIEQISGLGVENIGEVKADAEEDDSDDLPSAYCTIIMNHQRLYKTRTKMKSTNPYVRSPVQFIHFDFSLLTVYVVRRGNREVCEELEEHDNYNCRARQPLSRNGPTSRHRYPSAARSPQAPVAMDGVAPHHRWNWPRSHASVSDIQEHPAPPAQTSTWMGRRDAGDLLFSHNHGTGSS